jgi:hypothetical protein
MKSRHSADRLAPQPAWDATGPQGRGAQPGTRRRRRRRDARGAQIPYLVVLALTAAGLALIWQGGQQHVRGGTVTVAGAVFLAALARLVLPERRAGMLASRQRFIDVTALAILATGLLVAGLVLPTPS